MRRVTVGPCTVLAGAAGALLWATPSAVADSDLGSAGGLTYIQGDSVPLTAGGTGYGYVEAGCPSGTKVVGGGVTPNSSPVAESRINSSYPVDLDSGTKPDDGWAGYVYNISGAQKSFIAHAICKNSGRVRYRTETDDVGPTHAGSLTAGCPGGTHLAGGGVFLGGLIVDGYLNRTYPSDDGDADSKPDDGWRGRVYNVAAADTYVNVTAICLTQRLQYVRETGSGFKQAYCPGTAHLTGGGASITGPADEAHLNFAYPFADPANPPDDGLIAGFSDNAGDPKTVSAFAICKD